MKKIAAMTAVLALGVSGSAFAERVTVPGVGYVGANEGGYAVIAEGDDASGLGPLQGFISVRGDGQVCADDNGHAVDGNPDNDPDSSSPTCSS